ncbi:MAG: type III secretion system chaperone [Chlamydiae bacterium]|nr:type III secretion system chaperone [Chlamydiota bacterium]
MLLKHLLTELCSEFTLPLPQEVNKEGYYEIPCMEGTLLLFKDLNPGFTCKSLLSPAPEKPSEDFLILLMHANFLGQGTNGAAIAMDDSLKHILLILSVPEELNYRLFKEHLENFMNHLDYWKKRISKELH